MDLRLRLPAPPLLMEAADGSVILLENTRFYADEEDRGVDDGEKFNVSAEEIAAFRGSLGKLADIYVSDA